MSAMIHGDSRSSPSDPLLPKIKTEHPVDFSLPDDYMDMPQDLTQKRTVSDKESDSGTSEKQTADRAKHGSPAITGDGRLTSEEESRDDESSGGHIAEGSNGHANGGEGFQHEHGRITDDAYDRNNRTPVSMVHHRSSESEAAVRHNSSRDELTDPSKYSPATLTSATPDCNSQSDDLLGINENFKPIRDRDGNQALEVDCGSNSGLLYINKLCQGSKGQSIYFNGKWFTPNEFQYISGRETAKDWKRSIRHRGKSLKILMSRGLLSVHTSAASECSNCKMNMAMSRARYSAEKNSSIPSNSLLTVPTSTTMSAVLDKAHRRSLGDTDSTSLNQIIHQLHQTNGFTSDASKKRPHLLLEMSAADIKRPRSKSPMEDDIYEEQQRRIFQAANSPEPHIIENVTRSLNISTGGSGPPSPASLSPPSLEDQVNRVMPHNGDFILRSPQSLTKHQNKSSRKQISPQHIDLANADRESSKSPHMMFSSSSAGTLSGSNTYHKQSVMRQRYHSQAYNLSSRTSSSAITPSDTSSRRTQSLLTPTTKSSDTPMIALTRPDLATSNGSVSERSRASGMTSTSQVADDRPSGRLSADAVFFPSDMNSWTVDDVVQFVQSLKGCDEYAQLFREQAIDGEILPVLTEDHLLQNMGMKLGPALKIRLHIAKRLGFTLNGQYCTLKTPYEEIH